MMNGRQRSRRRQRSLSTANPNRILSGSRISTIGTAALAIYGTYKLASWAWNTFKDDDQNEEEGCHDGSQQNKQQGRSLKKSSVTSSDNRYQNESHQQLSKYQLQSHLSKCQREARITFSTFLPTLLSKIDSCTKMNKYTKALKRLRQGNETKDERGKEEEEGMLWKKIQMITMTRMISTVYAHSTFYLVLWVQIHILAGRMIQQQKDQEVSSDKFTSSSSSSSSSLGEQEENVISPSHKKVLKDTVQNFISAGIPTLIQIIEDIVCKELEEDTSWSVIKKRTTNIEDRLGNGVGHGSNINSDNNSDISSSSSLGKIQEKDVELVLQRICHLVELKLASSIISSSDGANVNGTDKEDDGLSYSFLISLFMNANKFGKDSNHQDSLSTDTKSDNNDDNDPVALYLWDETCDILESPIYEEAQSHCFHASFNILRSGGESGSNIMSIDSSNRIVGWKDLFVPELPTFNADSTWTTTTTQNCQDEDVEYVPLVNVLTQLKKITKNSFSTPVESLERSMQNTSSWWNAENGNDELNNSSYYDDNDSIPNIHIQAFETLSSLKELGMSSFYSFY